MSDWLHVRRSASPLILAMPHGGTIIPAELEQHFASAWHARRDADWHIAALYDELADATIVATDISRCVIDVNRDPSGLSLYPGQATTELCPTTDFDGAPLYRDTPPDAAEIARRRATWFDPYHAAITSEIGRLRAIHPCVVLYDCHSIRSHIPRLFDGELPELNIGSNGGSSCAPALVDAVAKGSTPRSHIVDGRFKGGWTTRHYGRPDEGIHAIQMEIAMRAYLVEPTDPPSPANWPPAFDLPTAARLRETLATILAAVTDFARDPA